MLRNRGKLDCLQGKSRYSADVHINLRLILNDLHRGNTIKRLVTTIRLAHGDSITPVYPYHAVQSPNPRWVLTSSSSQVTANRHALWFHLSHGAAQICCTAWARSNLNSKEITARGRESIWLCSLFISSALYYWYFKIRSLLVPRVIKLRFRDASVISHSICLEFAHRGEMLNLKWWAFRFWKTTKTLTGTWQFSFTGKRSATNAAFSACRAALPKQRCCYTLDLMRGWWNINSRNAKEKRMCFGRKLCVLVARAYGSGEEARRRTWQGEAAWTQLLPRSAAASASYESFAVDISQFASFSTRATYLENGSLGV